MKVCHCVLTLMSFFIVFPCFLLRFFFFFSSFTHPSNPIYISLFSGTQRRYFEEYYESQLGQKTTLNKSDFGWSMPLKKSLLKNEHLVIVYSPSCHFKLICCGICVISIPKSIIKVVLVIRVLYSNSSEAIWALCVMNRPLFADNLCSGSSIKHSAYGTALMSWCLIIRTKDIWCDSLPACAIGV